MNFIDYDSNSLISFYIDNGLEFDENKGYFGKNVKSYVILEKEQVPTFSKIRFNKDNKWLI